MTKIVCLAILSTLAATPVRAVEELAGDPHRHHRQMMEAAAHPGYHASCACYELPDVTLRNPDGQPVDFRSLTEGDRPLVVNFIFTTCTTICPVMSNTFAGARAQLAASEPPPLLVSISIDPEHDTPAVMKRYAESFSAGPDWLFLTGSIEDITRLQRAMGVYRGSKLNHEPVTLIKRPGEPRWLRLDGFTGTGRLVQEYRERMADPP